MSKDLTTKLPEVPFDPESFMGEMRSFDELGQMSAIDQELKDSQFSEYEKSALEECDFYYLMRNEEFANPSEELVRQVIAFYTKKAADENVDPKDFYEEIYAYWGEQMSYQNMLLIAGDWMLYNSEYFNGCLLPTDTNLCVLRKALEEMNNLDDMDNQVFITLTTCKNPAVLRTMVQHFGRAKMLEVAEYIQEVSDEGYKMGRVIGRLKRFKT